MILIINQPRVRLIFGIGEASGGGRQVRGKIVYMEDSMAAAGAVIEPEALARLDAHGGTALVVLMVERVLATAEERMRTVRLGLASGDTLAISRAAHSLKSSAAIVGATRLQELSAALEQRAASRDEPAIPPLVAGLESVFDATRELLLQEIRRLDE